VQCQGKHVKHLADLTDPKVAARYAGVLPSELEKFQAFCHTCPYKQVTVGGVKWPYLVNKDDGETLLLLSGALAIPDISWLTIAHFAKKYHVIAPAYPAVKTMAALVDGIAEILHQEGIEWTHVLGGSYGGFVAQVFVRRHPGLTRSLVLSHTFPPDPVSGKTIKRMVRWLPLLPEWGLRRLMGKWLGSLMPAKTAETTLLVAMFEELLYHRLNKADILSTIWRTIDYCAQEYTPQDLAGWPGKVLLVIADDDPSTPEPVRAALSALYPSARLHLFHGTGHVTSVSKEEEYQAVIGNFLDEMHLHTGQETF
jgi:pimeloyl-ACP methyl ester carboxylesterase